MRKILMVVAVVLLPMGAFAQDFNKGGIAYQAGDYAAALKEWKPLAEQGNAGAQYNLGAMYEHGEGVIQDYAEAAKWYRFSAEQGDSYAQAHLGIMYDGGRGVIQDYAEAVRLYRLASEQGYARAQTNLGLMYEYGIGVLQNNTLSHMWFNIASANGNDKADEWRDERAGLMSQVDISKAQGMARECMSSNYTKCGY